MQDNSLDVQSQQAMDRWRQRRQAAPGKPAPAAGAATAGVLLMMVVDIILEDEQYGPHLLTVPVAVEGAPPVIRYLSGPVIRCYPMPGGSVEDHYNTEILKVYVGSGASLAEKIV
jgi:hypothetical protein